MENPSAISISGGDEFEMRRTNSYVQLDPAVIEQARQMDLLTYLRHYEPSNLKRVAGNVYCTAEHDSLKISNGKWYWWSRGFGGVSALDYLIKVKEYSFVEAVQTLTGEVGNWIPPPPAPKKDEPKELLLPKKNKNCDRVTQYLFGRGIDYQLIQDCVADGTIFESAEYHNAVFVGKDESGTPKYAACRSTLGSSFKGDASGSDKRYSFRLLAKEPTDTVHLFEAAIDLLSYATYLKCEGKDYRKENLLSLSGVYQPKKEIKDSKVPIALTTFLNANPHIKTIILHLDNDKTGRLCTAALKELLNKEYKIVDAPPPVGKDFNDFLLSYLGMERKIIIAAMTGLEHHKAKLPTHIVAKGYEFLKKDSLILLEQIRTLDKQRLQEYIGTFDRRLMLSVDKALAISIGLDKKD